MNTELPLYQGALPQAPQQQFAQVPQLPRMQMYGEQLDTAIAAGLNAVDKYADLHDFGVRQEAERRMRQNELEMQADFDRKSALPPGAEGSFYTAEGQLNEDAVAAFTSKWQQKNRELARPFWRRENAMRADATVQDQNDRLARNVGLNLLRADSANRARAFESNFNAAVGAGDMAGACRILNDARRSGQITGADCNNRKVGLARRALKHAGSGGGSGAPGVLINGTEYSGISAALAAQKAKDGVREDAESGTETAEQTEPPEAGGQGGLQMEDTTDTLTSTRVELVDAFFETGDFGGVLPLMPQADVSEFAAGMQLIDYGVVEMLRDDGSVGYSCSPTAPEVVERAAAHADEVGGLTETDARSMIANISAAEFSGNPGLSDAAMLAVFKDSGVYEALGAGDAEVGKLRAQGMIQEIHERMQHGTDKLGMASIDKLVANHLASDQFRMEGEREWHDKTWAAPYYSSTGRYDEPSGGAEKERWDMWYNLYRKYRALYAPKSTGDTTKVEFEKNASAFYNWYMKGSYKEKREADAKAAKDWYMAEITEALRNNMTVGKDGKVRYGGYASDLAIAREVLKRRPPANLGVDALEARRKKQELDARSRAQAAGKRAAADFEKLKEAKQYTAEHNEKALKAKQRQEAADARKAEKEQRDAEQAAEKKRIQRLNAARMQPREASWDWDGRNPGDGAVPSCTLPEEEYRRLKEELGYDETQAVVYLRCDKVNILVTGANRKGKVLLNTPACAKIQKTPNAKKGEKWRYSGKLGYSYVFKNF